MPRVAQQVAVAFVVAGISAGCGQDAEGPQLVSASALTVIDGDTVTWRGNNCILVGFDAPEPALPAFFEGDQEPWASEATALLKASLTQAARVEVSIYEGEDKYGRMLVQVYVDGVPVGAKLIAAGLAYSTVHRYETALTDADRQALLASARGADKPKFDDPHVWRRSHSLRARRD